MRPGGQIDQDLSAPNPDSYSDKYTKFEVTLPFCRTNIVNYVKHIDDAEKISGGNGYVT